VADYDSYNVTTYISDFFIEEKSPRIKLEKGNEMA